MTAEQNSEETEKQFGAVTRAMANMCHDCKACAYADRKPDSLLGKLMRWHRTWCPAWAAHTRVYGEKPLS